MKILILVSLLVLSFGLSAEKIADEVGPDIYISNISPWLNGENGRCSEGIICSYFNLLLNSTAVEENFVYTSLARANEKFYAGEQFIALFPYEESFAAQYHLVGEVFSYDVGLIHMEGELDHTEGQVCITRNNPHKIEGYNYVEVNGYDQCFGMLTRGRVNFVLLTSVELDDYYENHDSDVAFTFEEKYSIPLWLYLSKSYSKDSGVYKDILNSYELLKGVSFNQ